MVTINKEKASALIPLLAKAKDHEHIDIDSGFIIETLRCDLIHALNQFDNVPAWLNAEFSFPLTQEQLDCMCWVDFPEVGA